MNFEKELKSVLARHKINIDVQWNTDTYIRNGAAYLKAKKYEIGGKEVASALFGDWKITGDTPLSWQSFDESSLSKEELESFLKQTEAMNEEHAEAIRERDEKCIEEANRLFEDASDRGLHPYLERKSLKKLYGARIMQTEQGYPVILVPMKDIAGVLWNVQRIYAKDFEHGNKFALSGRTRGLFHTINSPSTVDPKAFTKTIYICEGFATGASIHEATGCTTIVSFNADNMVRVASIIKTNYGNHDVVIAADNDAFTKMNKGRSSGVRAALENSSKLALPSFKDVTTKPTDFNDLHILEGLESVKEQLNKAEYPNPNPTEQPKVTNSVTAHLEPAQETEILDKKKQVSELFIVNAILKEEDGTLLKQGKHDFFKYNGKYWQHIEPHVAETIYKRKITTFFKNPKFKDVQSAWNTFLIFVPTAQKNMFGSDPYKIGFNNGTLDLVPNQDGSFELKFREHRMDDYLTFCHSFNYLENAANNAEFEESVENILGKGFDPDYEKTRDAYYEVLGACMVPGAFRKIVFFIGPPQHGKSTLILFAYNLVHKEHTCSVDPTKMDRFNLQSMAGKLMNYDTDISLSRTLTDSVLKKIEDRIPMRIERKGLADIYAPIPGMHLFGANSLPRTEDGAEAYDRRILGFECIHYRAPDNFRHDYANYVWNQNPQGIILKAIEGLKRLCANRGQFTNPETSHRIKEEWKKANSDYALEFLNDIESGEFTITSTENKTSIEEHGRVTRPQMYAIFNSWWSEYAPKAIPPNRKEVFSSLRKIGLHETKIHGTRYFSGIKLREKDSAQF